MFQRRPAEPERPTLDTGHLARLQAHLGPGPLAELVADALISLSDRIKRLGELERDDDPEAVARLAHDLVGMAGNLGLKRLAAAAVELEREARHGAPPAMMAESAAVRRHGIEAADALRRHLARLSGPDPS